MPYQTAIKYLESLIPDPAQKRRGTSSVLPRENMRLERIEHLLRLIGNPQNSFRSIHVGGTSGKGSTAYITAAILKEAGYKTGLHVSPHLERINERMQFFDPDAGMVKDPDKGGTNGKPVSDAEFAKLVQWIKPFVKKVGKEGKFGAPSYFEALVAMSFEYFKRKKVEVAVIEVGLGGALDATNVLKPEVAVITNVGLDHTEILGNTVEKIARDKSGIIKEGIEVITAARQKSVLKIIKDHCKEKRANLTIIKKHPNVPPLRLIGEHQKINAACAIAAAEKIQNTRHKIQKKHIEKALQNISIPGRFEVIILKAKSYKLKIILDGAHNPDKIKALAVALKELFPKQKITFVFAVKKNKDAEAMLRLLAPLAGKFYFTRFQATTDFGKNQSMPPEDILKTLKKINPRIPAETTNYQLPSITNYPLVCFTGSLYLVGEVRRFLKS